MEELGHALEQAKAGDDFWECEYKKLQAENAGLEGEEVETEKETARDAVKIGLRKFIEIEELEIASALKCRNCISIKALQAKLKEYEAAVAKWEKDCPCNCYGCQDLSRLYRAAVGKEGG